MQYWENTQKDQEDLLNKHFPLKMTAEGRETIVAGFTIDRIGTTHSQPCNRLSAAVSLTKQRRHSVICPVSIVTLLSAVADFWQPDEWFTLRMYAAARNQVHLCSVIRKLLHGKGCRLCIPRNITFLRYQKVAASALLLHSCYLHRLGHLYNNLACGLRIKIIFLRPTLFAICTIIIQ
jgi:hypothetical protein